MLVPVTGSPPHLRMRPPAAPRLRPWASQGGRLPQVPGARRWDPAPRGRRGRRSRVQWRRQAGRPASRGRPTNAKILLRVNLSGHHARRSACKLRRVRRRRNIPAMGCQFAAAPPDNTNLDGQRSGACAQQAQRLDQPLAHQSAQEAAGCSHRGWEVLRMCGWHVVSAPLLVSQPVHCSGRLELMQKSRRK